MVFIEDREDDDGVECGRIVWLDVFFGRGRDINGVKWRNEHVHGYSKLVVGIRWQSL